MESQLEDNLSFTENQSESEKAENRSKSCHGYLTASSERVENEKSTPEISKSSSILMEQTLPSSDAGGDNYEARMEGSDVEEMARDVSGNDKKTVSPDELGNELDNTAEPSTENMQKNAPGGSDGQTSKSLPVKRVNSVTFHSKKTTWENFKSSIRSPKTQNGTVIEENTERVIKKTGSILKRTQSANATSIEINHANVLYTGEDYSQKERVFQQNLEQKETPLGNSSHIPRSDSRHQLLANVSIDSDQSFSSVGEVAAEDMSRDGSRGSTGSVPPVEDRDMWSSRFEYLLSAVGYVTGLHNVWTFPVLCVRNGGGSFLLPYFMFLMMAGLPLVFLEVALSQYTGKGAISVWKVVPGLKGLGYGMVLVSLLACVYDSAPISWLLRYLQAALQTQLPWESCDNKWNTQNCCLFQVFVQNCSLLNSSMPENITCMACIPNATMGIPLNLTMPTFEGAKLQSFQNDTQLSSAMFVLPTEEYYKNHVLSLSRGIGEFGGMQWELVLCTCLSFVFVFLCLVRGVKSMGKIAYLTVIVPFLIMIVLLCRVAMLPGSAGGVVHLLRPSWKKLKDSRVWYEAASHVFTSLGVAYGGHITLASYCSFTNPCYRSSWIVCVVDSLTSVFVGFVVTSLAGHAAYLLNVPVTDFLSTASGPRLVFEILPWISSHIPVSPAWAGLFFVMLVLWSINRQTVRVLTIVTALVDEFPVIFHKKEVLLTAGVCVVIFLLCLPFNTEAGLYLYTLLSRFSTSWCVLAFALLECVAVGWVYGYEQFSQNVCNMGAKRPGRWWRLVWQYLTPAGLMFVLVNGILLFQPLQVAGVTIPVEAIIFSAVLTCFMALSVPVVAVYTYFSKPGSSQQRWPQMWSPAKDWIADLPPDEGIPDYIQSDPEPVTVTKKGIFSLTPENLAKIDMLSPVVKPVSEKQPGDDIDTGSIGYSEDENKDRGNWSGQYDFLMSGLGYTIGLGNVWRFPYLVYKNGGGAFFVPYIVMLVFCGMPLFYMELAFGQFASCGPISIWRVSPFLKGLGYSACLMVFFVTLYYNVFNAWSVMYFFASMTSELPWTHCHNSWNTPACRIRGKYYESVQNCTDNELSENATQMISINCTEYNVTIPHNFTSPTEEYFFAQYRTPSEEYFFNYVLGLSSGIEEPGELRWHLCLCLLLCWLFTFVAVARGIKSVGKVVYITVSFPYIILLILLARYVTLGEGHLEGIRFYVTPKWSMLASAQVWGDAASQLFFSLGVSMGGLIALSSYNRFHYDCFRDAYMVCLIDTLTSVFAGFVIFAILGVMAKEAGLEIENVVTSKFLLAYIVYPEAVTRLPVAPLWSLLFFLMMFMLAVDSQFLMVEGIVTALLDEFPQFLGKKRIWLILILCVVSYFLGLCFCTQGGLYMVELVDRYVTLWGPLVNGILMCVALGWVYGTENFSHNIKAMLGKDVGLWWKLMWKFVTPLILLFILVFGWVMYEEPTQNDYHYPVWAHVLGLSLSSVSVLCIPVVAVIQVFKMKGSCHKKWQRLLRPSGGWGPALRKHQLLVKYLPGRRRASDFSIFSTTSTDGSLFTTEESANFSPEDRSNMENPKIVISSPLKDDQVASSSGSGTSTPHGSLRRSSRRSSNSSLGNQATRRRHSSGKHARTALISSSLTDGTPDKSIVIRKPLPVVHHVQKEDKATQTYRKARIKAIPRKPVQVDGDSTNKAQIDNSVKDEDTGISKQMCSSFNGSQGDCNTKFNPDICVHSVTIESVHSLSDVEIHKSGQFKESDGKENICSQTQRDEPLSKPQKHYLNEGYISENLNEDISAQVNDQE